MNPKHLFGGLLMIVLLTIIPATTNAAVTPDDPANFITTWNTENTGTSNNDQITIPGTGGGYNYELYWVNTASSTQTGTTTVTTDSHTITFPTPGIYEVQASGTFPRIYFNSVGDKAKILTVEQWGGIVWTSMGSAFYGAANLTVPATDAPDLSGVTDMSSMFNATKSFDQPIDHWDVSTVSSMYALFSNTIFNQPLNSWNTTSLSDIGWMFHNSPVFNQPIDNWDVSNVTSMVALFIDAEVFNQSLGSWNTASVTDMRSVFRGAQAFNQPLDNWDTSNVTTMWGMFSTRNSHTSSFNHPLNSWDTSKVTDLRNIFDANPVFNQDLSSWSTASVTLMSNVFSGATSFNQNLSTWDVSGVTDMESMLIGVNLSTQNLNSTLTSWVSQSLQSNVPFHLGAKTYTSVGEAALNTMRDTYNWTITEQYLLQYDTAPGVTIFGDSTQ